MDTLLAAIKAAGGDVEVVRVIERAPFTEAILRIHIDGLMMTLYVVSSRTHVAATFQRPAGDTTESRLAKMMPLWS
jgi:hypothetical protein